MPATDAEREAASAAPAAKNKWLTASVTDDAAKVVGRIFDEAARRDPEHQRPWVALVDGNNHQIDRIKKEAKEHKVTVTIVVDFVHVLEYLWGSAWCFFKEGDPAAEQWVRRHAQQILAGKATRVAIAIAAITRGRLVAGTCRPQRKANAYKRRCAIYTLKAVLTRRSNAGKHTIPFSGRIANTPLKPGTYLAAIAARIRNGPSSKLRIKTFTIVSGD
jgi:hypothetical protein